jgi:hypothetical protein
MCSKWISTTSTKAATAYRVAAVMENQPFEFGGELAKPKPTENDDLAIRVRNRKEKG